MKRGISPLISYTILIGLVVLFFVLSGSWFKEFSSEILKRTGEEAEERITCSSPDAMLEVESACYNKEEAVIVLGAGGLEIERFILYLTLTGLDEQITLETSVGLPEYRIKRFSLSSDSEDLTDASKTALIDINFRETEKIKVIPEIINNGKEAICTNLIKETRSLECCRGGDACGCSGNEECEENFPSDICFEELCVQCENEGDCSGNPDKLPHCDMNTNKCVECRTEEGDNDCSDPEPYCVNNVCVECTTNEHCESHGEDWICNEDNECVSPPTPPSYSCNDLDLNSFNWGSNGQCLSGNDLPIHLVDIDHEKIDRFRIIITDSGENTYEFTVEDVGDSTYSSTKAYNQDFNRNNFLSNIRVIPIINNEECDNVYKEEALRVEQIDIAICCDQEIQCNSDGTPEGDGCCDSDCGQNWFLHGIADDGSVENDACSPIFTDQLAERYCEGNSVNTIVHVCSEEGYSCPSDLQFCQFPT